MKKWTVACVALAVSLVGVAAMSADDPPPIKEIMKKAHTPPGKSLLSKVTSGKASDEEKKQLVELYEALGKNKPPKGDEEEWKKRTDAMIAAAKDVAEGAKGAPAKLGKTVNCGACHKAHRA